MATFDDRGNNNLVHGSKDIAIQETHLFRRFPMKDGIIKTHFPDAGWPGYITTGHDIKAT